MRTFLLVVVAITTLASVDSVFAQEDPFSTSLEPAEFAKAIQQRKDPALRADALAILQENLREDASPSETTWALSALQRAITAKFDREPFRTLVFPKLQSDSAQIRELALVCLPGLDSGLDSLETIAEMVTDSNPKVRVRVGYALIQIGRGEASEAVIPVLTTLLKDADRDVVKGTIRSMWGQYASSEFDALLIEMSYSEEFHHIVVYHALSPMKPKSVAVCERLIEVLGEPDWNNSGRAAWGLTFGVPEAAYAAVEEAMIAAIPEELNVQVRQQEYHALKNVATEKSRPMLDSVIASEMETDKDKERAQAILDKLDRAKASADE